MKIQREVVCPSGSKTFQLFHIAHEQVVAVVIAGDKQPLTSTGDRNHAIAVLELVEILNVLCIGVVGKDGDKSTVIVGKIEF